jgi:hypothetical protein
MSEKSSKQQKNANRRPREAFSLRFMPSIALLGAIAYALAVLVALTGCGPSVTPAVTMRMQRTATSPKDASVVIDEQYVGTLAVVAARGVRLPIGEHRITVEKEGYFPYDELVTADRDDIELKVELQPIPD